MWSIAIPVSAHLGEAVPPPWSGGTGCTRQAGGRVWFIGSRRRRCSPVPRFRSHPPGKRCVIGGHSSRTNRAGICVGSALAGQAPDLVLLGGPGTGGVPGPLVD